MHSKVSFPPTTFRTLPPLYSLLIARTNFSSSSSSSTASSSSACSICGQQHRTEDEIASSVRALRRRRHRRRRRPSPLGVSRHCFSPSSSSSHPSSFGQFNPNRTSAINDSAGLTEGPTDPENTAAAAAARTQKRGKKGVEGRREIVVADSKLTRNPSSSPSPLFPSSFSPRSFRLPHFTPFFRTQRKLSSSPPPPPATIQSDVRCPKGGRKARKGKEDRKEEEEEWEARSSLPSSPAISGPPPPSAVLLFLRPRLRQAWTLKRRTCGQSVGSIPGGIHPPPLLLLFYPTFLA